MKDPLVGDSFWEAFNGFHDSKNNGVKYPDMFEQMLISLSYKFSNHASDLRYTDEKREEMISNFEALIPGSTGRGADRYFKDQNLKRAVATILEQNALIVFNRQVPFTRVKS